jgi:hypothetical protein
VGTGQSVGRRSISIVGGRGGWPIGRSEPLFAEAATGQQLGVDVVNTFTLTLLFNPIADMSEIRTGSDTKITLCELADDYKLPGVAPEMAQEARDAAKQVIAGVLQNSKPFNWQ